MQDASKVVKTQPMRIAVIGRAGSGKTTVALRLGAALDLPVVHLDPLFWGPNWHPVALELFEARQAHAIAEDAWIVDGGYLSSRGWQERLSRADLIVLVEAPLIACLWRVARRSLARGANRRPDLPDGCNEQMSPYFLWWTLGWSRRHRNLGADIHRAKPSLRLITIRDDVDLQQLLTEGQSSDQ